MPPPSPLEYKPHVYKKRLLVILEILSNISKFYVRKYDKVALRVGF